MSLYYMRADSMTQATTTFAAVETGMDGSNLGPIAIPPGVKRIKGIVAGICVDGAHTTDTGPIFVLRLSGTGALPDGIQEIVIGSEHLDDGGGTLTYTDTQILEPLKLETDIAVNAGADLSVSAAYYGSDAGSPNITIELEFE
jgi:hypothetical protein